MTIGHSCPSHYLVVCAPAAAAGAAADAAIHSSAACPSPRMRMRDAQDSETEWKLDGG